IALFSAYKLDPLVMLVPISGVLFALGYVMQRGLINPFINRPEHSQFMLLVAVALIMVNGLLIVFGPDAQSVQTRYAFDSFLLGVVIVITGGLGSMPGALLGGVLIGITEALGGLLFTPSAKSMFAFGLLVLVLLFRPQGILGKSPS